MAKRCVIPDCLLEDKTTQFFYFPIRDPELLDQWIARMPLLNFTQINLKKAVICEYHFSPNDLIDSESKNKKVLMEMAVPENFPVDEELNVNSCRFCLRNIEGQKHPIDEFSKFYYKNLMQAELKNEFLQYSCEDCLSAIRNCSFIKNKIQENQMKLASIPEENKPEMDFLEIKMEEQSDEDYEEVTHQGSEEEEEEVVDVKFEPVSKRSVRVFQKGQPIKDAYDEDESADWGTCKQKSGTCPLCKKFYRNLYVHKLRNHRDLLNKEKKQFNLGKIQKRYGISGAFPGLEIVEDDDDTPEQQVVVKDDADYIEIVEEYADEEDPGKDSDMIEDVGEPLYEDIEDVSFLPNTNITLQKKGYCKICKRQYRDIYQHKFKNHRIEHLKEKKMLKQLKQRGTPMGVGGKKKRSIVHLNDTETIEFEVVSEDSDSVYNNFCEICQKPFSNIKSHYQNIHKIQTKLVCDICDFQTYGKKVLIAHMKTHQSITLQSYTCEFCNKDYLRKESYRSHIDKYHLKRYLLYCEYCGKEMANKQLYMSHVATRHTGLRHYKCELCPEPKFFGMKRSLDAHIERFHEAQESICQQCGLVFPSKPHMMSHFKRAHAEKRFICDYEGCGQRFVEGYRLKFHIRTTHLGIRDYECQLCGKLFKKRDKVNRHILQVHTKIKFNCEVKNCKAQFARKDLYKSHVSKRHADIGAMNIQLLLEKIDKIPLPNVDENVTILKEENVM